MTRYVQKIVTNKHPNLKFRLRAPDNVYVPISYSDECGQVVSSLIYPINAVGYGRVKLGGGSKSNYKMRVRIIYSNL